MKTQGIKFLYITIVTIKKKYQKGLERGKGHVESWVRLVALGWYCANV